MRGNRIALTRSHRCAARRLRIPNHAVCEHRHRILGVEPQPVGIRENTVGAPAGQCLQLGQPRSQEGGVAAELVDHESRDELLIFGFEHRDRPVQVGQQPAAVDVADQYDGQIRSSGQTHVGQIGCAQIDLSWRSRAFTDHRVEFVSQ